MDWKFSANFFQKHAYRFQLFLNSYDLIINVYALNLFLIPRAYWQRTHSIHTQQSVIPYWRLSFVVGLEINVNMPFCRKCL